jgi:hypothetical protein
VERPLSYALTRGNCPVVVEAWQYVKRPSAIIDVVEVAVSRHVVHDPFGPSDGVFQVDTDVIDKLQRPFVGLDYIDTRSPQSPQRGAQISGGADVINTLP